MLNAANEMLASIKQLKVELAEKITLSPATGATPPDQFAAVLQSPSAVATQVRVVAAYTGPKIVRET